MLVFTGSECDDASDHAQVRESNGFCGDRRSSETTGPAEPLTAACRTFAVIVRSESVKGFGAVEKIFLAQASRQRRPRGRPAPI